MAHGLCLHRGHHVATLYVGLEQVCGLQVLGKGDGSKDIHLLEGAVAVVVVEANKAFATLFLFFHPLVIALDEHIGEAVVVVVAEGNARIGAVA